MKKVTLFIGLNDKDSKKQEISALAASKIISNILVSYDEAGTITDAVGIYKHKDGTVITENSLKVEIYSENIARLKQAAFEIKGALNQESILFEVTETESNFI